MKFKNQVLSLQSEALPADTLVVAKLRGQERLSGLFRFDLELISQDSELDLEAVLHAPATLGIKVQVRLAGDSFGVATREIAGVFAEFEQLEELQGWTRYRAVLVPKLWTTTRYQRSRVFQEMAVEDVVRAVLQKDGLDPELDFEFRLQRAGDEAPATRAVYPEREYIVQYEESDWDFVSRWLEHEGIYFYFVNEDGKEKVVFADTESAYAESAFGTSYPYRPESSGEGTDSDRFTEEEIRSFRVRQTRLPTQVAVNDYNWRVPSARLHYSEPVAENGTGLQTEYNDHFKDEAQGKALAKVRREELECRAKVFHGAGSCRAFRPGTTFELDGHFRSDCNRRYLLVSVEHVAEQMIGPESTITGVKYENSFEAIGDDRPWRPERTTAWPCIKGVMHARVDAEGDGNYAELDEHGRYKLRLPFDEHSDEAKPGKASRWVRMAQPYAGAGAGMHFPLLKGTEVLITHIDGDPDRPVIAGAVPNPETESPATGANRTHNGFLTASGNAVQIDDDEQAAGFLFRDARRSFVSDLRRHVGAADDSGTGARDDAPAGGSGGAVRGDEPASGRGMPTAENFKESAFDASSCGTGVRTAWDDFISGQAIQDVATGRYRDGRKSLSLSTWDEQPSVREAFGEPGDLPGQPCGDLDAGGMRSLLHVLAKMAGRGPGSTRGHDTSRDNVDAMLGNIHNFTGEAFGSRIRSWVGDDYMVRVGDNITYADVSNDLSVGTGGHSWHEEHGDTFDYSYQWGRSESTSQHWGAAQSTSCRYGAMNSTSTAFGLVADESFTFGVSASFALRAAVSIEGSVNLGAYNSNSLLVGLVGSTEVCVAGKASLQVGVSAMLDVYLCAAFTYTMKCTPSETELNASHRTKLSLKETIAELERTQASLSRTRATVANNQNDILTAANRINDTKNALNNNNVILARTMTSLNRNMQALNDTATVLSQNRQQLLDNNMAALHSIS